MRRLVLVETDAHQYEERVVAGNSVSHCLDKAVAASGVISAEDRGPASPEQEKLAQLRRIVRECQAARVAGCMLDLTTASMILAVHDKLSPENQQKLLAYTPQRMAMICFRLCAKAGS